MIIENSFFNNSDNLLEFLDLDLLSDFAKVLYELPVFSHDPSYIPQYNMCCAVIDRLYTSVTYLNKHSNYPNSEEDFLVFMMFASMVSAAVKEILKQLDVSIESIEKESKYFKDCYCNSRIYNPSTGIPSDNKFFEYFRSLVFAHPCRTDRAKFLQKNEEQYSPLVFVNDEYTTFFQNDNIGVSIYTNQSSEIITLYVPFHEIKNYIASRYKLLECAIEWVKKEADSIHERWKKVRVNRNQSEIEILEEIRDILKRRYEDYSLINELIIYMQCHVSEENKDSVSRYRRAISDIIPFLCDSVDNIERNRFFEILDQVLYARPRKMYPLANYQLEKIFTKLRISDSICDDDEHYARIQAKDFAKQFASKWVIMDIDNICNDEIRLLTSTACYLEKQEQDSMI